jgi:hypothetical protein
MRLGNCIHKGKSKTMAGRILSLHESFENPAADIGENPGPLSSITNSAEDSSRTRDDHPLGRLHGFFSGLDHAERRLSMNASS